MKDRASSVSSRALAAGGPPDFDDRGPIYAQPFMGDGTALWAVASGEPLAVFQQLFGPLIDPTVGFDLPALYTVPAGHDGYPAWMGFDGTSTDLPLLSVPIDVFAGSPSVSEEGPPENFFVQPTFIQGDPTSGGGSVTSPSTVSGPNLPDGGGEHGWVGPPPVFFVQPTFVQGDPTSGGGSVTSPSTVSGPNLPDGGGEHGWVGPPPVFFVQPTELLGAPTEGASSVWLFDL